MVAAIGQKYRYIHTVRDALLRRILPVLIVYFVVVWIWSAASFWYAASEAPHLEALFWRVAGRSLSGLLLLMILMCGIAMFLIHRGADRITFPLITLTRKFNALSAAICRRHEELRPEIGTDAPEFKSEILGLDYSVRNFERVLAIADEAVRRNLSTLSDQLAHQAIFSLLIDNLRSGVLVLSVDGQIHLVNQEYCDLLGLPGQPREMIGGDGMAMIRNAMSSFSDPEKFMERVQEFLSSHQPTIGEELQMSDGRVVESDYLPIHSRDGRLVGHMIQYRDVTERKKLVASLLGSSKRAAFGEVATSIAHEINSPLTIITCNLSELQLLIENPPPDPARIPALISEIEDTAIRISELIQSVLVFNRDGDLGPVVVKGVSELVQEALALCQEPFRRAGMAVIVGVIPEDARILCHPVQLSEVLLNLLNNARDAVEELPERWVRIEATPMDGQIRIVVTDSGRGIPPAIRERITEPFFTTKPVGKGTGLGLSISKRIIEKHSGRFYLDTASARTSFVIELPLDPSSSDNSQTIS